MYDFISLSALSLDEVLALTSRIFKQESTSPQLVFLVELGFGDGSFCGGRKTGKPGEKPRNKARANNKLNPHKVTPGRNGTWAGMEPGPQWWKAIALTTLASPLSKYYSHGGSALGLH